MSQPLHDPESGGIDAQDVIDFLGRQVGGMSVQLAMRDVRGEQQQRRIAELEQEVREFRERAGVQPEAPAAPGPDGPPPADDLPTELVPQPPVKAGR
jgi:hypothetical protein